MFSRCSHQKESACALLSRAAEWSQHPTLETLDAKALRHLTKTKGVDFATAVLFDRFRKSPRHADFLRRIDELRRYDQIPQRSLSAAIVIVPAALYKERPEIGGDGRLVREIAASYRSPTELIPLASMGSVIENARLICAWMEHNADRRIILVSLSKGGADLKMALKSAEARDLFRNVVSWINVCGPLNGCWMTNWIVQSAWRRLFFRMKFRLQGRDFRVITDLCHGPGSPLDFSPPLPPRMKMLTLIGFPFSWQMTTPFSRFCHRTLASHGPNDGATLLSDLENWPGQIYPALGMDHYFRPEPEARSLIRAVLASLSEEL